MLRHSLVVFLTFCLALRLSHSRREYASRLAPYAMRISCGARNDVHTPPTNTLWYKDFGYTGGIPTNGTRPSFVTPPLDTIRYFPLSEGPENCYNINRVPKGHYSVRIFFGLVAEPNFDNEPLFDVSVEGTQIESLKSGWNEHDDEQAFVEALIFLTDGSASLCFHSTGHGDPAILAIEILQVDDNAYHFGSQWGQGTILKTDRRLSCGAKNRKFDVDYSGDHWGGDSIKQASTSPNFYPEALYQTALASTDIQPNLAYTMDVDPNRNYSIWFHFAEIDPSVTGAGQRVFDILINGDVVFQMWIFNHAPTKGHALINAVEIFEVIAAESKTLPDEVSALQTLKSALGLPLRFGWNGDPCVPQQHPWSGADCQFDKTSSKWVIDGLNLSENSIHGPIPSSVGTITSLVILYPPLGIQIGLYDRDLSYNFFNGSIPESLGQLTSLRRLFTDNAGLCGIPGLRSCGPHLSFGAKIGIALGSCVALLLIVTCLICWWKRRQNILRAQIIAAREAPYAKARTHFSRDVQMTRPYGNENARTATENGPILLS
ncbi:hypothetical protein C3L33_06212, partial [Rhododendron williamsianum]